MKVKKAERVKDALQEKNLFIEYSNTQDPNLRNIIVSKYLYLAEIISKKFINRGVDYDDIYQVACIALIKAVERFDVNEEVKFISFATPTIIGEVKRFFRDKASVIRIPRRIYEVYQKVNHARETLMQELKRNPRVDEIAAYINISEENVLEIIESWNIYNMQSFNQTVFNEDDLELHETIGYEDYTFDRIDNRDFLLKTWDNFNEIEKKIIKMRYFDNKTQREIADNLEVSQMYVSRLERKIIDKYRKILRK